MIRNRICFTVTENNLLPLLARSLSVCTFQSSWFCVFLSVTYLYLALAAAAAAAAVALLLCTSVGRSVACLFYFIDKLLTLLVKSDW